jgi:hypothetical protein
VAWGASMAARLVLPGPGVGGDGKKGGQVIRLHGAQIQALGEHRGDVGHGR